MLENDRIVTFENMELVEYVCDSGKAILIVHDRNVVGVVLFLTRWP